MKENLHQTKLKLKNADFWVVKGIYELVTLVHCSDKEESKKSELIKKLLSDSVFSP